MIAADTSRSRAYLQALARNGILPNRVLLMERTADRIHPGQDTASEAPPQTVCAADVDDCWSEACFDPVEPMRVLLDRLNISYVPCRVADINDASTISLIRQRSESVFIYSGFGGALLRRDVLSIGVRFLHVHGGYLPDYKGSTTNYYSLLAEGTLGASALFLSEEIDSGPVLLRRKFPVPADVRAIDHIFDAAARAKVLVDTLRAYVTNGTWEVLVSENNCGETYYVIHPVLKHIAILGKARNEPCE
jgi:methionyl-tRNA formyltransferase